MKYSNKRVSVKNLKYHVSKKMSIHPDLKSDSVIKNKKIEEKIKKKHGENIEQKVSRSCIATLVEELLDENDND